jgi:5-methylcytosine-specific restriction endonuclease McrA|tara:strand:+ start:6195 stop:6395 length:201 start_codon:yes stop_codon:yes gene_type:complete
MRRNFNKKQKKILAVISGNRCVICDEFFRSVYHADHIKPFSKKGKTTLKNGQALCPACNLSKGSKI